jgi:AraC-like DNA-binding protein
MSGARIVRSRAMVAQSSDMVVLCMPAQGTGAISQLDRDVMVAEGDAVLVTSTEPWVGTFRSTSCRLNVALPSTVLLPMITQREDALMRPIPRDTDALRMLASYVGSILQGHALASPELQNRAVAHVHDLAALAIGATRDAAEVARGRGARAARLYAIKQDIAANLDQAGLSAATLAARHRCSPRTVQMLFEAEGTTFTEYVQAQRLARVHRMLTDPRHAGEKISAIAFAAGFHDLSHFNRAFRLRFGGTPSDVRTGARLRDR